MKTSEALKIVGGLSKPSKMPGWAYGLQAAECKTGSKLAEIPGTVCYGCYALKGCYVFPVVQAAQYRRLAAIRSPLWTGAMALLINSKKSKEFRWHDSGDVQDEEHLLKIFAVAKLTPQVQHWMPPWPSTGRPHSDTASTRYAEHSGCYAYGRRGSSTQSMKRCQLHGCSPRFCRCLFKLRRLAGACDLAEA